MWLRNICTIAAIKMCVLGHCVWLTCMLLYTNISRVNLVQVNSHSNSIRKKITFLDTRVKIDKTSKTVYTDLYTKDTNTKMYLHYTTAHPAHCKKSRPFGEFLRIRRNCHKLTDFEIHANARMYDYIKSGYPKEDINRAKARQTMHERHCTSWQRTH